MRSIHIYLLFFGLLLVLTACQRESYKALAEPVKNINGSWQVTAATRNGTDLFTRFDFSAFRINFADSAYTVDNPLPFIVNKAGAWRFDDPVYPFNIFFTPKDSASKSTGLLFPITVSGQRNIIISFSPGCASNTYQYTLQKVK